MRTLLFFYAFVVSTFFAILQPSIFPYFHLIGYAPFFAFLSVKYPQIFAIFAALATGVIIDLFTITSFGFNALCYTLAFLLLYPQKKFFADKIISLSLYTMLFSTTISIIRYIFCPVFSMPIFLSIYSIITDVILMPIVDGIYGVIFIFIPIKLIEKIKA